jgi:hypothetical protein
LLIVFVSVTSIAAARMATAEPQTVRWKYRLVTVPSVHEIGGWKTDNIPAPTTSAGPTFHAGLKKIGEDGWEFAGTLPGEAEGPVLLFKKPQR